MSSRHLHPVAARVSRSFRAAIVSTARRQGISVSALIKEALHKHLGDVDAGVNAPPRSAASTAPVLRPDPTPLASDTPRKLGRVATIGAASSSPAGVKPKGYFVEGR